MLLGEWDGKLAGLLDSLSDLPLARKLTEGEIDFEAEGARAAAVTGKDNCVRALQDPETPRFLRFGSRTFARCLFRCS